ncbi:MAG: ATP-binding cassette domain-containing protein [Myxococcota bacterium]
MGAIEVHGLSKSYGDVRALRKVSFDVHKGEIIGLLGPNGAGKTTLMKILSGYIQPDRGEARVAELDVVTDPLAVQKRLGYLPENAPLYGEMSVQEYLVMMATLRGIAPGDVIKRLSEAIHATGLERYLTKSIATLSKGYKQRVGLAQAIVHRPEVLILDEPTTGLDPAQIAEIRHLIRHLAEHSTILLSTHILPEVEMTCERVLIIMGGQLRADSSLTDLRASSAAVVSIAETAQGVQEVLSALRGVKQVRELGHKDGYRQWRVETQGKQDDLCPEIFNSVRQKNWSISELRSDPRTLETVFRELSDDVQAGSAP